MWDTGVTSTMMNGSYALIHSLQMYLVALAAFYPPGFLGSKTAESYFDDFVTSRFEWHRAHLEPEGPGTGGTIVGPMAAGSVINDLEGMVLDVVRSLTMDSSSFNYTAWKARWDDAA
jgi:hypothetical protein